jgi:hypothetical protein
MLITSVIVFSRFEEVAKIDFWLRHVNPSVRMEQLASYWKDFHEILHWDDY